MYCEYQPFSRHARLHLPFFEVTSASGAFQSEFTGYFGFKPHIDMEQSVKAMNIMYKLKEAGTIHNNVLALWISKDPKVNSLIKVGGWDRVGLAPG